MGKVGVQHSSFVSELCDLENILHYSPEEKCTEHWILYQDYLVLGNYVWYHQSVSKMTYRCLVNFTSRFQIFRTFKYLKGKLNIVDFPTDFLKPVFCAPWWKRNRKTKTRNRQKIHKKSRTSFLRKIHLENNQYLMILISLFF